MREMNFNIFQDIAQQGGFTYKPENLVVEAIKRFVNVEGIKEFYPKNIFLEGKQLEVFVFTDKNLTVFSFNQSVLSLKTVKYDLIKLTELSIYSNDRSREKIVIQCEHGEYVLDPFNDTNDTWNDRLAIKLPRIYSLINN